MADIIPFPVLVVIELMQFACSNICDPITQSMSLGTKLQPLPLKIRFYREGMKKV